MSKAKRVVGCTGRWRSIAAGRLLLCFALFGPAAARAQKITVSGSPGLLQISTAVPGLPPTSVSNSTTTYTLSGRIKANNKITAQINSAMPSGVTLALRMAVPSGGTSLGDVALGIVARDILTNFPKGSKGTAFAITYTLSATVAAGVVPLTSRTVTLTIVNLP